MNAASTRPHVSVIIPTFQGRQYLAAYLPNVVTECASHPRTVEILVVDNGSTDGSAALLAECFPSVQTLVLAANTGFAEACDRGIRAAGGAWCLLFNNDAWFCHGSLEALLAVAEAGRFSIAGPAILNPDGSWQSGPLTIDLLGDPAALPIDAPPFFLSGAALLLRRDDYLELGGFDRRFFAFYEEADLQWRAHLYGKRLGFVPQAMVFHVGGGTLPGALLGQERTPQQDAVAAVTSQHRLYLGRRNQLAMLLKNYSASSLLAVLPLWAMSGMIECLGALALRYPAHWRTYAAAILWNMENLPRTWRERRSVQRSRKVTDAMIRRHFAPAFMRLRIALHLARRGGRISVL